jgi:hypothetical protein
MRFQLIKNAEVLNSKSLTPADYCIMGMGMDFEEPGNADHINEKIKEYFEENYQMGSKIQYTNAAYNIGEFYSTSTRYNDLNGQIALVEYYIEQRKTDKENPDPEYNEDKYREDLGAEEVPKGFPKAKIPGKLCGKAPINIDEARNELKEVEETIKSLESEDLGDRFLGIVFIIVERPTDASRVLNQ